MSESRQGWFRGFYDYVELTERIKRDFERKPTPSKAIALIQLANGCRVGEAIEAYREWLKTGNRKPRVRVEKRGWDRKTHTLTKPVYRVIEIPSVLEGKRDLLKNKPIPSRFTVYKFLRKKYGINTHTLRYEFITYMVSRGVRESLVAQITGHAKLDTLARYVERIVAERLLERHVEAMF